MIRTATAAVGLCFILLGCKKTEPPPDNTGTITTEEPAPVVVNGPPSRLDWAQLTEAFREAPSVGSAADVQRFRDKIGPEQVRNVDVHCWFARKGTACTDVCATRRNDDGTYVFFTGVHPDVPAACAPH